MSFLTNSRATTPYENYADFCICAQTLFLKQDTVVKSPKGLQRRSHSDFYNVGNAQIEPTQLCLRFALKQNIARTAGKLCFSKVEYPLLQTFLP